MSSGTRACPPGSQTLRFLPGYVLLLQLCARLTAEIEQHRSRPAQQQQRSPVSSGAGPSADSAAAAAAANNEQIATLQQQLEDVQQQLENMHADANNSIGLLRQQLAEARSSEAAARGEAAEARGALMVEQAQVANLKLRMDDMRGHEEHMRQVGHGVDVKTTLCWWCSKQVLTNDHR
jgi:DNA repair exonuclease SbcCD ATPase subunit